MVTKEPSPLNSNASQFRPKRTAAAAAKVQIGKIMDEDGRERNIKELLTQTLVELTVTINISHWMF